MAHRKHYSKPSKRDPAYSAVGVQKRIDAVKPGCRCGHYNNTLGQRIAVSNRGGSSMSLAKRKARVTLAKVW